MAYQQMMGNPQAALAYQHAMMQQQQMMMMQQQMKRAAPQGLNPQFASQGPQQKKRRSKRDESDDDEANSDSDEEGGQWRGGMARMPEAEQPVRRSSRRAAAEGVKRLTQALHGPSEFDEDE
eukprot:gene3401-3674_t